MPIVEPCASGAERARPATRLWLLACAAAALSTACLESPKSEDRSGPGSEDPSWVEPPEEVPESPGVGPFFPDPDVPSGFVGDPPQASLRYVYVASPTSGTVSIIDSLQLGIQTVRTGDRPSYLTTIPGSDDAIVINVGSEDASLITIGDDGIARHTNFEVVDGANTISMAPDGAHAVIFFDANRAAPGDTFGDFQTVSVVALDGAVAQTWSMSVGFKPSKVFFQEDGTRAFVVNEAGISILDFAAIEATGDGIAPIVAFGAGSPLVTSTDISITPDGRYAIAREDFEAGIRLLDLTTATETVLDLTPLFKIDAQGNPDPSGFLPQPVTVSDLDLSESGAFALAVVPRYGAVLQLPIPQAFGDTSTILRRGFALQQIDGPGSGVFVPAARIEEADVVPGSSLALTYFPGHSSEEIHIVDFAAPADAQPLTIELRKRIKSVQISPDGSTALIVHSKERGAPDQPNLDFETRIDRSYGYSLLRPDTGDAKLQITDVAPVHTLIVPDSSHMFLTFINEREQEYSVHRVDLDGFVIGPIVQLDSRPIALGAVEGPERVFVSQDHPDGRLTFVEWQTADIATVTGFEINSQIRD